MKARSRRGAQEPQDVASVRPSGVVIQDDGPSGRELLYLATVGSTLVISVSLAVAIWRVATGIMWAVVIMSVGVAIQTVFIGAGIYCRYVAAGQAEIIRAQGERMRARRE